MTEEQYNRISEVCDRLLRRSDSSLERIAIPFLHILNEHPVYLSRYAGLDGVAASTGLRSSARDGLGRAVNRGYASAYRAGWLVKNFSRAVRESAGQGKRFEGKGDMCDAGPGIRNADVVIIAHLVTADHLDQADDFYFGSLQKLLSDRGLSSHLLLRNQTGQRPSKLFRRARRDGASSRELLPDVATVQEELGFLKRCMGARRELRRRALEASSRLEEQVARRAGDTAVSGEVAANLRLHGQIREICRRLRPSIVITLYEGHAWERCVWHAARAAGVPVLCVGYQHTILRRRSHAIKRSLGHGGLYDPDVILTVGESTREVLETRGELGNTRIVTFGTHRRDRGHSPPEQPNLIPAFLVLPEGIESECIYLFRYALECASRLPNVRFIFRTHPVLPFERIESEVRKFQGIPANVEISRRTPIEADFKRSGYILYRGSSTVIYGILAGLKPFYVARSDEMSIDPLVGLGHWRENVMSVDDLIERYASQQGSTMEQSMQQWRNACEFCDSYVQPLNTTAIDELITLRKQRSIDGAHVVFPPMMSR